MHRLLQFITARSTWTFLVSMAVCAVVAVAFFYPDNFKGNDLRQHDMVQGIANGQEVKAFEEATGETSRWTNSLFSGMPTFQISPSYPSDGLFRWVTRAYGLWLPSPSNLLFMMMLGMLILMAALKVPRGWGLVAALGWGLSSYFVIIIGAGHIWKFATLAYIPPTIAGVILAYRGRYIGGGALTAFFTMMQLCSNHVQMTYYFGFVILALAIAYGVTLVISRRFPRWLKATGTLLVAAALGVCANLPNLYHTYKYAAETQRGASELAEASDAASTGGLDRGYITQYSYGKSETWTLLIPNVKGGTSAKPVGGQMTMQSLADLPGARKYSSDPYVDTYLNYSTQYFGEPESTNGPVYVGAIIFALFLMGALLVHGPVKWALLAVTALTVALSWGRNFMGLTDLFIDLVPMYNKFRTPESILVVAQFAMPVLGVMGLATLFGNPEKTRSRLWTLYAAFGFSAFICLLCAFFPSAFGPGMNMETEQYISQAIGSQMLSQGYPQDVVRALSIDNPAIYSAVETLHYDMASADAWRSLLFVALGFGVIYLVALLPGRLRWRVPVGAACLCALVTLDLYLVDKRYVDHSSFVRASRTASPTITPTAADRIILEDSDPNFRVLDIDRFASAEPSYFHKMIGGYHAAKLGRYQDLIDRGMLFDENIFDMLNARYIINQGEVIDNPYANGNAWFVDQLQYVNSPAEEITALETIDTHSDAVADVSQRPVLGESIEPSEEDTVYLTSYAPNRLAYEVNSAAGGIVAFSEIYFPWGWEAEIDGKPAEIGRVNYVLRAMRVPAGSHEIVMTFAPASVGATVTVATIAVILIYIWVLGAVFVAIFLQRRKK